MSALICAAVNSMGGFIFGYFAVGIHPAEGTIWACMYNLTGADTGHVWLRSGITTMVNVGAMVGALGGGHIIRNIGYRGALIVASIFTISGIWTGFASSYWQQTFARILAGFGLGLITSTTPSYVDNFAPAAWRGTLGTLFQVFCTLGILASNIFGYFLMSPDRDAELKDYCNAHPKKWLMHQNLYLILPAIFLAVLLGLMAFVIESSDTDDDPLIPASSTNARIPTPKKSWAIGIMGAIALQLTGINAVMFFGTNFFKDAGFKQLMLGQILIGTWNFIATMIALTQVDRFGRRKLLLPSLFGLFSSLFLLSICDALIVDNTTKQVMNFVLLVIYIASFEAGPGCLFWVICNEIFPTGSPAFSTMNGLQWVFTLIVTATFPGLRDIMNTWVFMVYSVFAGITFVFHLWYLPETKGIEKKKVLSILNSPSIQGYNTR